MSHFIVTACVEHPDALEKALAPYDENLEVEPYRDYEGGEPAGHWSLDKGTLSGPVTWADVARLYNEKYGDGEEQMLVDESGRAYSMSTRNPDAKWDYWRIGGRWGGRFPYRQEHAADIIRPERGWDSPEVIMPMRCDGGPKRALDLDALREEKAVQARKEWQGYRDLVAGTPDAIPWAEFRAMLDTLPGYTIDRAREEYHSQPRVQAIKKSDFRYHDDPVAEFAIPVDLYAEKARAQAIPGFAMLTLDGRWMAPGRMGWFAATDATDSTRIGYLEAANAYIGQLPDDAWLIAVDCHI
jgi:hypothetical protein